MLKTKKYIIVFAVFIMCISAATQIYINVIKKRGSIELSIVGDIMLSRGVDSYISKNGYSYPYENLKNIFLADDLTIVNLECPITEYGRGANKPERFVFKAKTENANAMKEAGIDLCNLANNHTMDYRSEGLKDTMENLSKAGISYVGAGENANTDMSYIFEKDGFKIGILAYSIFPPEGFVYDENSPGINYLVDHEDLKSDRIREDLKNLKADFKIIYFHWGIEYEPFAGIRQKELARIAIDSGADFIVGAHPHVIQDKEVYKGKYIYYSLGNCIFDKQIPKGSDEGLLLSLSIDKFKNINIKEKRFKIKLGQPILIK